jgi:hypothetical protein
MFMVHILTGNKPLKSKNSCFSFVKLNLLLNNHDQHLHMIYAQVSLIYAVSITCYHRTVRRTGRGCKSFKDENSHRSPLTVLQV